MTGQADRITTQALSRIPLFAGLEPDLLERLASMGGSRRYPMGQIFWHEGDAGNGLLVIEEGSVRITRTGPAGHETVLAIVDAPAAVGELALIDGVPRDATVTAVRAVTARVLSRTVFLSLLRQTPSLAEGLLTALAAMVRSANTRHARQVSLDVPGRLAAWLLDRTTQKDLTTDQRGVSFPLRRNQGDLAAELGTTRSTLNRALATFQEQGMLALHDDTVTILRADLLRQYIG